MMVIVLLVQEGEKEASTYNWDGRTSQKPLASVVCIDKVRCSASLYLDHQSASEHQSVHLLVQAVPIGEDSQDRGLICSPAQSSAAYASWLDGIRVV